jgi:hypothetical protein
VVQQAVYLGAPMPKKHLNTDHPLGQINGQKVRCCDFADCTALGSYPAPKNRASVGQKSHYYFCLEHIRLYNAAWDYFAGATPDEIYDQMRRDAVWDKPTAQAHHPLNWQQRIADFAQEFFGSPKSKTKPPPPEYDKPDGFLQACATLQVPHNADMLAIKKSYRRLAKLHHPDSNPAHETTTAFLQVQAAYQFLKDYRDQECHKY